MLPAAARAGGLVCERETSFCAGVTEGSSGATSTFDAHASGGSGGADRRASPRGTCGTRYALRPRTARGRRFAGAHATGFRPRHKPGVRRFGRGWLAPHPGRSVPFTPVAVRAGSNRTAPKPATTRRHFPHTPGRGLDPRGRRRGESAPDGYDRPRRGPVTPASRHGRGAAMSAEKARRVRPRRCDLRRPVRSPETFEPSTRAVGVSRAAREGIGGPKGTRARGSSPAAGPDSDPGSASRAGEGRTPPIRRPG